MKQLNQRAFHFLSIFLLLFLSSCAHLAHLDHAQDSFSKGAAIENKSLLDKTTNSSVPAETYYALAYGQVQSALKSKGKLGQLGVLGSAYTIKALCEWKLKNYDAARGSAKAAKDNLKTGKGRLDLRRDYTVMEALDGLMGVESTNDDLYEFFQGDTISIQESKDKYSVLIYNEGETSSLQKALSIISTVNDRTSANNEVRVYLQSSKLAGLKVWSDALHLSKKNMQSQKVFVGENSDWYDDEEDRFLKMKKQYLKELKVLLNDNDEDPLYNYWNLIL
jgi:hypothetical protein